MKVRHRRKSGYWNEVKNQREFLDSISSQLNFTSFSEWNNLSTAKFRSMGGHSLLKLYSGSLRLALTSLYPEEKEVGLYDRKNVPHRYWKNLSHQRSLFDTFALHNNLLTEIDWCSLSLSHLFVNGGRGMRSVMRMYNDNLSYALKEIYPEKDWSQLEHRRHHKPKRYWLSPSNQRAFLDQFAKDHQIADPPAGWYSISSSLLRQCGGSGLLFHYKSLSSALQSIYPHHHWNPSLFIHSSKSKLWKDKIYRKQSLSLIISSLHIKKKEDWYRISNKQLEEVCGTSFRYNVGLRKMLMEFFPSLPWPKQMFTMRSKKSQQRSLFLFLSLLFPSHLIIEDFSFPTRSHLLSSLLHSSSSSLLHSPPPYSSSSLLHSSSSSLLHSPPPYSSSSLLHSPPPYSSSSLLHSPPPYSSSSLLHSSSSSLLHSPPPYSSSSLLHSPPPSSLPPSPPSPHSHQSSPSPSMTSSNGGIIQHPISLKELELYLMHPNQPTSHGEVIDKEGIEGEGLQRIDKDGIEGEGLQRIDREGIEGEGLQRIDREGIEGEGLQRIDKDGIEGEGLQRIEIDIYIPAMNIGVEYQGEQHYDDNPAGFTQNQYYMHHDSLKLSICSLFHIPLCIIPYWWDHSLPSLRSFLLPFLPSSLPSSSSSSLPSSSSTSSTSS